MLLLCGVDGWGRSLKVEGVHVVVYTVSQYLRCIVHAGVFLRRSSLCLVWVCADACPDCWDEF
jgi:hypothetical protein